MGGGGEPSSREGPINRLGGKGRGRAQEAKVDTVNQGGNCNAKFKGMTMRLGKNRRNKFYRRNELDKRMEELDWTE